jgi:hypothetical protein
MNDNDNNNHNIITAADYNDDKYHHNHKPEDMSKIHGKIIQKTSEQIFEKLGKDMYKKIFGKMVSVHPSKRNGVKYDNIVHDSIKNICGAYVVTYQLLITLEQTLRHDQITNEGIEKLQSIGLYNFDLMNGELVSS